MKLTIQTEYDSRDTLAIGLSDTYIVLVMQTRSIDNQTAILLNPSEARAIANELMRQADKLEAPATSVESAAAEIYEDKP